DPETAGCICKGTLIRDPPMGGLCVPREKCRKPVKPPKMGRLKLCNENETFKRCIDNCPEVCGKSSSTRTKHHHHHHHHHHHKPCLEPCKRGCDCIKGYIRDPA